MRLIDALGEGVLLLARDGTVVEANAAFCRLAGRDRTDVVGAAAPHPWWGGRRLPPPGRGDRAMALTRPDGATAPAIVAVRDLADAEGEVAARIVTVREAGAESLYRAVVDSAADAIVVVDESGAITGWNPRAEALFGHASQEALGRVAEDLLVPRVHRAVLRGALARLRRSEGAGRGEALRVAARRRDGSLAPVEMSLATWTDGSRRSYAAIVRDAGERVRAEGRQASLRRIATAVAARPATEFFRLVSDEVAEVLAGTCVVVRRVEGEDAVVILRGAVDPVGEQRLPLDGFTPAVVATRTGATSRVDDFASIAPVDPAAARIAATGLRAAIAVPVRLGERVWGAVSACSPAPLDPTAEEYLREVAHLVAVAAADAEVIDELRRSEASTRRLAAEQAALRRVAVAVADAIAPGATCAMVAAEAARLFEADYASVSRIEGDETLVIGAAGADAPAVGSRFPLGRSRAVAQVARTGRPGRIDDYAALRRRDAAAASFMPEGYRCGIAAPILLEDGIWGVLLAVRTSTPGVFPPDAEHRLGEFGDLVALAIRHSEAREELAARATTDPVTGLANHRAFHERLGVEVDRAVRHGRSVALALIDIDHFKRVNDAHGHQVGDRVIAEVGRRLGGLVRPGDLMARIGGDEFAWVLPETDEHGAHAAAEWARATVAAEPVDGIGRVAVSAGVCDLARAGSAGELVRLADGALYWAKVHGRDATYRYSPDVVRELSAVERTARLVREQTLAGLRALARAVDAKDHTTREHSQRVADLATAIGGLLGWGPDDLAALSEAGLLHDVGKIGVPDAILFKPGRLSPEEYEVVKTHSALGATIASEVLSDEQVRWIRHHHERWDGAGYPDRLSGARIPQGACLLALADAWDVMTHVRSYKAALPPEVAIDQVLAHSGTQFCPDGVQALRRLHQRGGLVPRERETSSAAASIL